MTSPITSTPSTYNAGFGNTSAAAGASSLSPEALFEYLSTRMSGIASNVNQLMAQQGNVNDEQQQIGSLLSDLTTMSNNAPGGITPKDPAACQALEQKLENLITYIQANDPGCSQLQSLEDLHDSIMATGTGPYYTNDTPNGPPTLHAYYNGGDKMQPPKEPNPKLAANNSYDSEFSTEDIKGFTDTLNSCSSALGGDAQLNMIKIQSAMSDQTTAITLATSILQAHDDGMQKEVDEIGK